MFAGQTRRGKAGPGTKDGTSASTVLHGSGRILLCFFFILPFLFFWPSGLCEDAMEARGADMMDESGVHGRKTGGGGGCRDDRDGGAQCRAPCLRGTCEAWGGPGWWVDPVQADGGEGGSEVGSGGSAGYGFYICYLFQKSGDRTGCGVQAEDKKEV